MILETKNALNLNKEYVTKPKPIGVDNNLALCAEPKGNYNREQICVAGIVGGTSLYE
jgi:hypothetical protein